MKKHILLASCAITTACAASHTTHEAWKADIEGPSTPRTAARAFGAYQKFAEQNPSRASEGPNASNVLKKFKTRVQDPKVPLDVREDTFRKGIQFQQENPSANLGYYYSGRGIKFDDSQANTILDSVVMR